jgi:hypothetical protein
MVFLYKLEDIILLDHIWRDRIGAHIWMVGDDTY